MPVTLRIRDLDQAYEKLNKNEVIIINDLPNRTEADQISFDYLIKQVYTSDMISMTPMCYCKELKGENKVGEVCPKCHKPVVQSIADDVSSILWFRKPKGVEQIINPYLLVMLIIRFKKRNFDPIRWLLDRNYVSGAKLSKIQTAMIQEGFERGYNYFVQNFDRIFHFLNNHPDYRQKKKKEKWFMAMLFPGQKVDDALTELINSSRQRIFSDYLPLPNRSLVVIEQNFGKKYTERSSLSIHNALNTMRSIDHDYYDQKLSAIESRMAKIMYMLAEYIQTYITTTLRPKPGLPRKHLYGGRGNHTFRAVITSHQGLADHDEIHIPWNVAVPLLDLHLMSILMNPEHPQGGMSHTEAYGFILAHVEKYHPRLDAILKELIATSRHGALISSLQRNPSQFKGSATRVRITKVKTNVRDSTVSMSDLLCEFSGADYDGDEVNFCLMTDHYMEDMLYPFSPFFNMLELDEPLKISGKVAMTTGVIASASEWLRRQKKEAITADPSLKGA